jgi:hypothetical protein
MTTQRTDGGPTIDSPTTRQLAAHIQALTTREASLDETVTAIRGGDNRALQNLVAKTQLGDTDAAIVAIWALHPRLCAVAIQRRPVEHWKATIDDYIALAYLTIEDIKPSEHHAFLADKIIARTRRRHERAIEANQDVACQEPLLEAYGAVSVDDVETQVLAQLEIDDLVRAVDAGLLTKAAWRNLVNLRIARPAHGPISGWERSSLMRAQQRLNKWKAEAA